MRRPTATAAQLFALVAGLSSTGCYSGSTLVERVRNDAMRNRLEELELGTYSLTMPRDPATTETVEIELRLFGTLARYRVDEVEKQLEEKDYLLRHATLMAIRKSLDDDFADPDLAALRGRLLAATNALLDEPSVQKVGFHMIRFTRQ
ncbi:MAG: hypothetical protein AAGJ46_08090 [Planctomycetota bacterium]